MELATCCCPNPECSHYGKPGMGDHLVHRGTDGSIPRLIGTMCKHTFSARHGTAYSGLRAEEGYFTVALRALAEGNSLRGTGRIVEVDKDTVMEELLTYRVPPDFRDPLD